MPSLIVFGLLAFGGFLIIYSITQDMTKLAQSMDPNTGKNMSGVTLNVFIFFNLFIAHKKSLIVCSKLCCW
jgi:hypothetical protein